ncbi:MAG: sigma-70 family RNA polymerase sigma factor [Bacteroidales bacterium]
MTDLPDHKIIELCRDPGSANVGYGQLVLKYQERVYWHIRRMVLGHEDADDLVQETFVKVWKALGSFREDSQLFTWIYRIATNETLTFLKKKKRALFISFDSVSDYLEQKMEDDNYFSGDEIQKKLQKALLQLPEKQKLVFNMKYFDDMKYEEISNVLGTSVGALKASYHIAVKKIEKSLTND